MKNIIVYFALSLTVFSFVAQLALSNDNMSIEDLINSRIESGRIKENPPEIKITDEQLKTADPNKILNILAPYEKDPEWLVRHMTHINIVKIASLHPDNIKVRQEVVRRLTESAFNGTDSGVGTLLMKFTKKDFSEPSKALIRQAMNKVNKEAIGGSLWVWLCGIANMQDQLPRLNDLLINEMTYASDPNMQHFPEWYYTTAWVARLARARMGVKEDIKKCIELAELEQDSDKRVIRILPDIGYIRQPEAIEYLRKYLESNKRLPPVKPTAPGELYASRAMHILAENLDNYPVKMKRARNYTKEEIDLCRKWMAKQTKWIIKR